jgi:uncharacterized membrane protein YphA (DoxX/SURF4 family)
MPSSTAVGLLILRVSFGLVIASHGLVKLGDFSGFAARAFEYPFLLGLFGVAFVVMGAGPYSLDAVVQRRLGRSAPAARV